MIKFLCEYEIFIPNVLKNCLIFKMYSDFRSKFKTLFFKFQNFQVVIKVLMFPLFKLKKKTVNI